jgi:hypothetical protein
MKISVILSQFICRGMKEGLLETAQKSYPLSGNVTGTICVLSQTKLINVLGKM